LNLNKDVILVGDFNVELDDSSIVSTLIRYFAASADGLNRCRKVCIMRVVFSCSLSNANNSFYRALNNGKVGRVASENIVTELGKLSVCSVCITEWKLVL